MDRDTDSSLSHELPTHLGVSQPLLRLGPIRLDVTTLSKLAVGCLAAAWVWQLHGPPPALRLAGVAAVILITLAFGVVQPAGQPLEAWLLPLVVYVLRPRLFVWRSRYLGHPWAVSGPTGPRRCQKSVPADGDPGPLDQPMSVRPAEMPTRASVQETTLDLLWIAGGVACFAGVGRSRLYRGVLAAAAPPEAFAGSDHLERALAGYTAVLNSLRHPFEVQVRSEQTDVDAYVQRWETRTRQLPATLATLAREHAEWARRYLPGLGLVERRLYLVVPAEDTRPPYRSLLGLGRSLRQHLPRRSDVRSSLADQTACTVLAERCERLQLLLNGASIRSWRLDDASLARLYRDGWGHRQAGEQRFDRDLLAFFAQPRQVA